MLLSRKRKGRVRLIASTEWNKACVDPFMGYMSRNQMYRHVEKIVAERIQKDEAFKVRGPVGGIVTSIILSLALKLAVHLLMKWLEDQLFEGVNPSEHFAAGEPTS